MSDFDEFERQLNENKQGEGAGDAGRRAGLPLAFHCAPRHFPSRFPSSQGRAATPTPTPTAPRRAPRSRDRPACLGARPGRGRRARGSTHARRALLCAPLRPGRGRRSPRAPRVSPADLFL